MNHFLSEDDYQNFADWAKEKYSIAFRRDEIKRNDRPNKHENEHRLWRLVFALYLEAHSDLS